VCVWGGFLMNMKTINPLCGRDVYVFFG